MISIEIFSTGIKGRDPVRVSEDRAARTGERGRGKSNTRVAREVSGLRASERPCSPRSAGLNEGSAPRRPLAARECPELGLTTVYRALDLAVSLGIPVAFTRLRARATSRGREGWARSQRGVPRMRRAAEFSSCDMVSVRRRRKGNRFQR